MTTDLPDWVTESATVVVQQDSRFSARREYRTGRVAKLTPTQIVLSDGSRYRRDTLCRVGGSRFRPLLNPADPEVAAELREMQTDEQLAALENLLTQYSRNGRYGTREAVTQARADTVRAVLDAAAALSDTTPED